MIWIPITATACIVIGILFLGFSCVGHSIKAGCAAMLLVTGGALLASALFTASEQTANYSTVMTVIGVYCLAIAFMLIGIGLGYVMAFATESEPEAEPPSKILSLSKELTTTRKRRP